MNSPFVSVILPVYNQEKFIAETIESILSQTFSSFELLILDDGSTDNSEEIIRKYASSDERIVAFYESNTGKCNATNSLVEKAKGCYCAFLDADDIMLPERLEKQVNFHLNNTEVDASSAHCYYMDEESEIFGRHIYPFLKTLEDSSIVRKERNTIMCAFTALMVSKEVYLNVGGLRKEFWPCEDMDFFHRLIDEGYNLIIIQEFFMKYRIHLSSITMRNPLHIMETIQFTNHNMQLRRAHKAEITRKEHDLIMEKKPWIKKVNRKMNYYGQILARQASFAFKKKEYGRFIRLSIISTILSPRYAMALLKNRLKLT